MRFGLIAFCVFAASLAAPANAATPIDVFLVAGQSNAAGQGDSTQSPVPAAGTVYQYYNSAISPGNDPVGNAATGSAWPAFGISYFNATGRKVLFVPFAFPTTAQEAAADAGHGNWDNGGSTLVTDASFQAMVAMNALAGAGYTPVFRGILWAQGETDALAIDKVTAGVSQANYEAALKTMIARFRQQFGSTMPFYIFKTGTQIGVSDLGFQQVRDAQEDVGATDPYSFVVFRNAFDFWWRVEMSNNVHYTQPAYNEMGTQGGASVAFLRLHPSSPKPPMALAGTGLYANATNVTLTSAGAGWIGYTLDGSAPSCTTSAHYSKPIAVAAGAPLIVTAAGCRANIASPNANYTYNHVAVFPPIPTASPAPGTYANSVSASLSSQGADSIRYVWVGKPLSCTVGTLYDGPIPLSPSHSAFQAIACFGAYSSAVQTYSYSFTHR